MSLPTIYVVSPVKDFIIKCLQQALQQPRGVRIPKVRNFCKSLPFNIRTQQSAKVSNRILKCMKMNEINQSTLAIEY